MYVVLHLDHSYCQKVIFGGLLREGSNVARCVACAAALPVSAILFPVFMRNVHWTVTYGFFYIFTTVTQPHDFREAEIMGPKKGTGRGRKVKPVQSDAKLGQKDSDVCATICPLPWTDEKDIYDFSRHVAVRVTLIQPYHQRQ